MSDLRRVYEGPRVFLSMLFSTRIYAIKTLHALISKLQPIAFSSSIRLMKSRSERASQAIFSNNKHIILCNEYFEIVRQLRVLDMCSPWPCR